MALDSVNTCLLYSKSTQKLTIRDKVLESLQKENEVPAFPAVARKLMQVANQQDADISVIADIVALDPGLTAQFLKLASSPAISGQGITSIHNALLLIGMGNARKIATSMLVMDTFKNLRVKVNWEMFWLHNLLTARLTERLADAYREVDGREYLAGLLHDVGKLFIEHYFPQEFELVILRASLARTGMYEAEMQLLDISHAETSALLCEKWQLHKEIVRSVRFHHDPNSERNKDPDDLDSQPFLAHCICIADKLANICHANIQGAENLDNTQLESLPEWIRLKEFTPRRTLVLDMAAELKMAEGIIASTKSTSPAGRVPSIKRA